MANAQGFTSTLSTALDRFLAHVVDQVTTAGVRDANDLIRHFPPRALMDALGDEPEFRAKILSATTGVRERVALKKSPESCGEDLEIALEEDETDTATIASFFTPDDLVRFLEHTALWSYVTEPRLWTVDGRDESLAVTAKQHHAFVLQQALAEGLLTPRDIVEGISVPELVRHLPAVEIAGIIEGALASGRGSSPFADEALLEVVPPSMLVEHVPLSLIWEQVVVAKLVAANDLDAAAAAVDLAAGDDADAGRPLFDEEDAHPDARKVEEMLDDIQLESGPIPVEEASADAGKTADAKPSKKKKKPPSLRRKPAAPPSA